MVVGEENSEKPQVGQVGWDKKLGLKWFGFTRAIPFGQGRCRVDVVVISCWNVVLYEMLCAPCLWPCSDNRSGRSKMMRVSHGGLSGSVFPLLYSELLGQFDNRAARKINAHKSEPAIVSDPPGRMEVRFMQSETPPRPGGTGRK